ncbi:MAG: hypothetical protein ACLTSX_01475 [Collinsella sp.]
MSLDEINDIREMDARRPAGVDREEAEPEPQHRRQVRRHGGRHGPPAAGGAEVEAPRAPDPTTPHGSMPSSRPIRAHLAKQRHTAERTHL